MSCKPTAIRKIKSIKKVKLSDTIMNYRKHFETEGKNLK